MSLKKVGDWDMAKALTANLHADLEAAKRISLHRFALIAEKIVIKHIRNQDLPWEPLSPEYVERKSKQGYSEKILVRSSTYFQAITSWVDTNKALVGVRRNRKNEDGEEIANIARIHEYGSKARNIEPRPLWRPSWEEAREIWAASETPFQIYRNKFVKKYRAR